ncbi:MULTISPECIES: hypothetical protein [Actinomadura]|uniref:Uncharacterized protein n=1 Tax=Actinomadura yumaensis TaxID=111807 RepID=A0ABW2CTC6_9ACTN|nr:hypothetical protein [Actinomadura sp. J1-007]MWK35219.1 hypothetical protein [Actinomadura sp. J1-007]
MPAVPPIVESATAGGPAYLIAWERLPDRSWGAHIAWVVLEGEAWKVKSARVLAEDVRQVEGQRYRTVPRRTP